MASSCASACGGRNTCSGERGYWSYLLEIHRVDIVAKRTPPNLLLDGTKLGVYVSALEPNSRLIFNAEYTRLGQLVRKPAEALTEDRLQLDRGAAPAGQHQVCKAP
jgi:hypothetical protein